MNDEVEKCSQCDNGSIVFDDSKSHSWSYVDPATGVLQQKKHRYGSCDSCGNVFDECMQDRNSPFAYMGAGLCDHLQKDSIIQGRRVLVSMLTGLWTPALKFLEEFESNELNYSFCVERRCLLDTIRACGSYFNGSKTEAARILRQGKFRYSATERSFEMVHDLLMTLCDSKVNTSMAFQGIKEKWFPSFVPKLELKPINPTVLIGETNLNDVFADIFSSDLMVQKAVAPLLFDVARASADWSKWPNDEVMFFEQVAKTTIPLKDNKLGSAYWFKHVKGGLNQLAFDLLLEQDAISKAFEYYESEGIDYIQLKREIDDRDEFIISTEAFPYYPDPSDWLPDEDLHEACVQCYYEAVWVEVLKYLVIMRFYESQLDDVKKKQHFGSIEDRLLILTVQHTRDAYLKSELLKWRIPPIVPRIYEKRKLWKEAMEYYRLANVSDEERKANLSRFNVDNRLFEELSKLSAGQQRQVLALSRMVVRVEPLLREYVRKRVKRRENWQADLEKVFPVSRKRQKGHEEFQLTLEETERRDILDWLTLPELLSLVVHPDYWPIFHENFSNQSEWMGLSNLIRIRNNLAHSIPLSSQQVDYCLTITDRILKLIS